MLVPFGLCLVFSRTNCVNTIHPFFFLAAIISNRQLPVWSSLNDDDDKKERFSRFLTNEICSSDMRTNRLVCLVQLSWAIELSCKSFALLHFLFSRHTHALEICQQFDDLFRNPLRTCSKNRASYLVIHRCQRVGWTEKERKNLLCYYWEGQCLFEYNLYYWSVRNDGDIGDRWIRFKRNCRM